MPQTGDVSGAALLKTSSSAAAGADFGNDMLRDFVKALLQSKNAFYEFNALMDRFLDSKHGTGRILWGRLHCWKDRYSVHIARSPLSYADDPPQKDDAALTM